MRVGMLTELHPELDHREISRLLVQAELDGGLDLSQAIGPRPGKTRAASKARP